MRSHPRASDAMLRALSLVRLVRDRNNRAALFYDAVGATERVGAHAVQHHIDIFDYVLEFRGCVIDCLIDTELLERRLMRRRSGRDHFRAARFGNWNGKTPDAARAAVNQD